MIQRSGRHRGRLALAAAVGLGACVLVMTPLLYFAVVALRSSMNDVNSRVASERAGTVQVAALFVGRQVAARGEQLLALAGQPTVRDALARGDRAALTANLASARSGHPDVSFAIAFDPSGVMVARSPDDPVVGQSYAERDYLQGALRMDGPYVGDAVAARATGAAVAVVAFAVRDASRVIGVIGFAVRPGVFVADLSGALRRDGREILLVDKSGATLASTSGRPPLGHLALTTDPAEHTMTIDGAARVFASGDVPGTTWTLYVLDDPAVLYTEQRAALDAIGPPMVWALLGAAALSAIVAIAYLMLRREQERLALANARLVEANTAVEAAARAKSDFLASMSHELRTPLNAVLGFSDVLREQLDGKATARQMRYVANIHAAGAHLLELINDVLDLSKVEAGRLELRPERVTLAVLLEPVIASAAQLAVDRGLRFDAPDVPAASARVDLARTRQVLLNLLSNAVKFTPPGGSVALEVAAERARLRFDVIDTGIGIPLDARDRVFGMFERLHEGRSDAAGTGLGLAITRRLVELQNGTIGFDSRPGSGTRFWVVFEDAIIVPDGAPRLLIVEDDPRDAELLAELARGGGLAAEVAPSAGSAMAAIERSRPVAVILDLRLPDRRGDDVLRALKSDPATADIPVLVVSVEDDDGQARLLGASDHMTKPIDPDELRRWIDGLGIGGVERARAAGRGR